MAGRSLNVARRPISVHSDCDRLLASFVSDGLTDFSPDFDGIHFIRDS
jgi:hypothetical protein